MSAKLLEHLIFLLLQQEDADCKYRKKNITSNWSRYEIASEEEDGEEEMTGPDFQYVISTALGAEAHFKFKCEQEWEAAAENLGQLREEFFSLDLSSLESVGPFHYRLTHDILLDQTL